MNVNKRTTKLPHSEDAEPSPMRLGQKKSDVIPSCIAVQPDRMSLRNVPEAQFGPRTFHEPNQIH